MEHKRPTVILAALAVVALALTGCQRGDTDALGMEAASAEPTAAHGDPPVPPTRTPEADIHQRASDLHRWLETSANYDRWMAAAVEYERQEAAARTARREARRASPPIPGTVPGPPTGRCGGSLPPCYVMMRESGGDIRAENPTSTASGKWQFLDSSWKNTTVGRNSGYARASEAPESVQDAAAAELWNGGAGCSHWLAC